MKILFCKVSYMKYYRGVCADDEASHGGAFVDENGYGHEEFNFLPIEVEGEKELKCFGFVETKTNAVAKRSNALHIEKIDGCEALKNEDYVDDVLVVWCACKDKNNVYVVGWYNHATVYRYYQNWTKLLEDGTEEERFYNIAANAKDCILLPESERNFRWCVPSARYTKSHGFGQALVWYANEESAVKDIERIVKNIKDYESENSL